MMMNAQCADKESVALRYYSQSFPNCRRFSLILGQPSRHVRADLRLRLEADPRTATNGTPSILAPSCV